MREMLTGLGAGFWALMGGAFVSVAIAVYIDTLQGDHLPSEWWLLLVASSAFLVCGVSWIAVSMFLEKIENAAHNLPTTLSSRDRETFLSDLHEEMRSRRDVLLWVGFASGFVGLLILPARILMW